MVIFFGSKCLIFFDTVIFQVFRQNCFIKSCFLFGIVIFDCYFGFFSMILMTEILNFFSRFSTCIIFGKWTVWYLLHEVIQCLFWNLHLSFSYSLNSWKTVLELLLCHCFTRISSCFFSKEFEHYSFDSKNAFDHEFFS